jgi:superfamily II DNA/RNA helicase
LENTKTVVLDEVDRMLDMGFVKEITELMSFLPKERQTLLFSATLDVKVEGIAMRFMKNPTKISVKTGATSQNVDQNVVRASGKGQKMNVLQELLSKREFAKVLVFGRTKFGVEEISVTLQKNGFNADAIHGDKRQSQREAVLRKFKANQISILCATDVAARGIDVKDITHVINFDQPATYEDYIHRIGRTGRAGKSGIALTFVD